MSLRYKQMTFMMLCLGLAASPAPAQVDASRCGGQGQAPCAVCTQAPSRLIQADAAAQCQGQPVAACDVGLVPNPERTQCGPLPQRQQRLERRSNPITVGEVVSPNPTLWVRPSDTETEFIVATSPPDDSWFYFTQFCSLMTLHWLREIADHQNLQQSFGFSQLPEPEQLDMAATLIQFTGEAEQIERAKKELGVNDVEKNASRFISAIELHQYPPGTLIWAGNDIHVVGLHVGQNGFELYDSNTGITTAHTTDQIAPEVIARGLNVFVVRQPTSGDGAGPIPGPSSPPPPKPSSPVPDPGSCDGWNGQDC